MEVRRDSLMRFALFFGDTMDFIISTSPKRYRERRGLLQTERAPTPRTAPSLCHVHELPLVAPLPDPQLLVPDTAVEFVDIGIAQQWPHGETGEAGITQT